MSFDRVLPKPLGLSYEPSPISIHRPASGLLEPQVMNDELPSKLALGDRATDGGSEGPSPYPRPSNVSGSVAAEKQQQHLSEMNRAKVVINKVATSASVDHSSKSAGPSLTKDIAFRERSSSSSSGKPATMKDTVQFCLCQPDPKIPRPRNAFILYRQHYQESVLSQHPNLANPEVSKIIGEQWRALPDEIKNEWKAMAEEEKARHQQQYPDYRYQPRRYGRDGSRGSSAGISHNSGSNICNRCGGRLMKPPPSPDALFQINRQASMSSPSPPSPHPNILSIRSFQCRARDSGRGPTPVAIDPKASRQRQLEESGDQSPECKRRRFNSQAVFRGNGHRDRSPESPYPATPYSPRADMPGFRGLLQPLHPPRPYRNIKEHPAHDTSLRLPPLQTAGPVMASTPITPFLRDTHNMEATVMTIPFLNKIKVLAKISPPLTPSFRDATSPRGLVVAVDGQDAGSVKSMVDYLHSSLSREGKYTVRIFEGPEVQSQRPSKPEEMGSYMTEYFDLISRWHRISGEIVDFIKGTNEWSEARSELDSRSGVSPKTIIPKTANLTINSPILQSSDGGSEFSASPRSSSGTPAPNSIPIALVPRYQLTTADSYACSIPLGDEYAPLDHWQWMATLWRACVGPDITVYIRECERDELTRYGGGNPVEVRLNDARTVIVRRPLDSHGELEEKAMKRVGFEVEDYLTQ
ncbi:hypothetical protein MAP00_003540 [Monascus purpureus]|nr:hypothetical protein MAP00_003540 [Monascus purpureus]